MSPSRVAYRAAGLVALGLTLAGCAAQTTPPDSAPVEVDLGQWPIIVAPTAGPQVRAAAADLAEVLGRITGKTFDVQASDGASGLALGLASDFPNLPPDFSFAPQDPLRREEYRIRSHAQGAWLIGATGQAVEHAVWDLLHRIGYRLFFLTDTWEVVPDNPHPRLALDLKETPDFHTRQAPRGAPWSDERLWRRWQIRNRVASAFVLHTGHAYHTIIRANREIFAAHPEFYALVNGERRLAGRVDGSGNIKFCLSNPALRRVVVEHAERVIRADPERDSISMDPSDGANWCECADCATLGSVSDRVLLLANEVAAAINALDLGPKFVGIYAYNQHGPPPSITAHPKVIVSVATSFIREGSSLEQNLAGWRAQGATLGIRDYHDVFAWSHDMPRRAAGGNLLHLQRMIPYYHAQGARFMNSENTDSWGANGLGYWITPRLLWRVADAENLDELVEDFLAQAFGPAQEPMREFFTLLNADHALQTAEHVVAMMYRQLAAARDRAGNHAAIQRRLDDLVLYTRYCELYNAYRAASGAARQAGFEAVLRHAYRMRDRMLLSTRHIYARDRFRDQDVAVPEAAAWNVPEETNPWKDSTPFDDAEISDLVARGIAANQPDEADFEARDFSADLIPSTPLNPPPPATSDPISLTGRHTRSFLVWFDEPGELTLAVTGGLLAHYRDRGNVKLSLFAAAEATLDPVATDESVPPDGQTYPVTLRSPYGGLHTLRVADGGDQTRLDLPPHLPLTLRSSLDERPNLPGRWSLYFYVPRGTRIVGGFTTQRTGLLRDGQGRVTLDFRALERPGYFSVPVPAGQDAAFWLLENCSGDRALMTVPPYLAPHPAALLLPREVVRKDSTPPDS